MATNYLVNVPKLKGRENYSDWAFAAENFLILEGLSKCIEEVVAEDDAKAKAKLILTVDTSLYVHIKYCKTAVELWNTLKGLFDDPGQLRKISLLRKLISTRLEECNSMTSYVNQIVELAQKLRSTGFKIDDEWIGSLLLAGLPERFSPMIMAIEHSGKAITADSIKTKLLDIEVSDSNNNGENAFATKVSWQQKRNNQTGNNVTSNDRKIIKCYKCKQFGHFKNRCPNSSSKSEKTSNAFSAIFINGAFSKSDWYIDSGASAHLTANCNWINQSVESSTKEIIVANKSKISVSCMGCVNVVTLVDNCKYNIKIKNVLCVPELTTNLLSVSQLLKNGNSVTFESDCCKIYNNRSELVAVADLIDGVYRLNLFQTEKCLLTPSAEVSSYTWHRRFGHLNNKYLNQMQKGAVNGLNFPDATEINMQNCQICCEGKQSRFPFANKGTRATKLLEIIHADVCGPMETTSIGGSKYFLALEDDYSRMAFAYFLKTKDEVLYRFKEFKKYVENQTNCKIKFFRTDNGGEFCNKEFDVFLKKNGIVHQKTNPYTPQQNGMSERLNRTVVEKAKCLLFDGKLDKRFWAEAVSTAVYLRNRTIASGLSNRTPHELWTKKKPDVSHVRIFGSTAMVHVPKEKRQKLDKKSQKCILVGYSETVKGYRLYNPTNNSVITSRDVIIMESIENEVNVSITDELRTPENVEAVGVMRDQTSIEAKGNTNLTDHANHEEVTLRRSDRIPKPKKFENYITYFCGSETDIEGDPTSFEDALSRTDHEKWQQAISEELNSFEENDAWKLVEKPENDTIVKCKWVFKRKYDSENNVRYRARLVAKGFSQIEGVDFNETFSPVIKYSSLRMLLALSVKLDLDVTHLDVTTAFLNGFLEENVFMMLPEGLHVPDPKTKALKLNKAIYGLRQSSRAWYKRVDDFLKDINFRKSEIEPCLYIKTKGNLITIVAIYVDDFLIFSNDKEENRNLKIKLGQEFKVKDLGEVRQCLGMKIKIDRHSKIVTLNQEQYIDNILKRFNMLNCKGIGTPIENNLKLYKSDIADEINVPYQQLIGSLMYLAVQTRPDITFAVSYLSQFNNCFNETHWKAAKRVLRYLKQTKHYGLKFVKDDAELEGFVDADWANDSNERKSYTGFCFKLSGSAISWESKKQPTVALSSTEAEYMAISDASREAIFLKHLLEELDLHCNYVKLYNDNQGALKLSTNPILHKRTKHIDVRHHFVRELVTNNQIKIEYLQTAEMPADILTKGLGVIKHYQFMEGLGITSVT